MWTPAKIAPWAGGHCALSQLLTRLTAERRAPRKSAIAIGLIVRGPGNAPATTIRARGCAVTRGSREEETARNVLGRRAVVSRLGGTSLKDDRCRLIFAILGAILKPRDTWLILENPW